VLQVLQAEQRQAWARSGAGDVHLYLLRWRGVAQIAVYGDEKLLFQSRGGAVWNGFNHPLWIPLAPAALTQLPARITIRLSHAAGGGAVSSAWVGPADEIRWRWRTRSWIQTELPQTASYALLALGVFALFVWAKRREAVYLYFAMAAGLYWVRCLHYYWGLEPIAVDEAWFGWATLMSAGWLVVVGHHMAFALHRRVVARWIERSVLALMALATFVMLPPVYALLAAPMLLGLAYLLILMSGVVITLATLWASWRSGSREALWLSASSVGQVVLGIHDLALLSWVLNIETLFLLPYGLIGLFIVYLAVAWRRYVQALRDAEDAKASLEARLLAGERELAASYERLRDIERERTLHDERQRLMQDMHDGLGSSLTSALRLVEHGHVGEHEIAQVLKECIDDLKLTIDSLEPVDTDVLLLLATLRYRLAPRLEKAGIRLHWSALPLPPLAWLTPRHALHILRIIQEAFTNVVKHAQATEITLRTASDADRLSISLQDNGSVPIQPEQAAGGRGLDNMRRRAQALGAEVSWVGSECGTLFELHIPRQNTSAEQ
jgi:signal transduction histidine kinase